MLHDLLRTLMSVVEAEAIDAKADPPVVDAA
jgi:hypothetical protein